MTAAETVARELGGLAAEMRAQADPGVVVTVDHLGLIELAQALERAAQVLRGTLPAAQLLPAEPHAPPGPLDIGNLVVVDFAGRRQRAQLLRGFT
jgi:hypothetical protein